MAVKSIVLGLTLIVLGVVVSIASSSGSVTSYIPAFIGVLFVGLGAAGALKPDLNHHMMHGAAMLGLLAIVGSVGSLVRAVIAGSPSMWAVFAQIVTIVLCAGFMALAIQSFKQARLARQAAATAA